MNRQSIYFSHDADAMNDPKCMLLIAQLGMEGYGTFWALVELLRAQQNYMLPLDLIPAIAGRLGITGAKLETVIKQYNLFSFSEDSFFFSKSLNDRMGIMNDKIERRRLSGKKAGEESAKARKLKALNSINYSEANERSLNVQRTFNEIEQKERHSINTNININTNIYGESDDSPCLYPFQNIWEMYEKKGNKKTSLEKWKRLSELKKKLVAEYIPRYVGATPDKQFRKNFEVFLNKEAWNDELPIMSTIKCKPNEETKQYAKL